jgi:hypothetical protein
MEKLVEKLEQVVQSDLNNTEDHLTKSLTQGKFEFQIFVTVLRKI